MRTVDTPLLGIDIGSVTAGLVLMSDRGEVLRTAYRPHHGLLRETIGEMLEDLQLNRLGGIACTSSTPHLLRDARRYDSTICFIEAARSIHGKMGALLIVGGEKFALLRFDGQGNFQNLKSSSSCAAGTGSFLDQQSRRLGLSGSAELAERALKNGGKHRRELHKDIPLIASRCSVFAKTDLSHAQQAGFSLVQICDGLCLGLARTIADTISCGQVIPSPLYFAGGVSRNGAVAGHLENLLGCELQVGELSHLYGALGACHTLREQLCRSGAGSGEGDGAGGLKVKEISFSSPRELIVDTEEKKTYYYEPLSLKLSRYPDFTSERGSLFHPSVVDSDIPVEVDLYKMLPRGASVETVLGIDVGSTSTKAVLIDLSGNVLAGFYTRTAGRPLTALRAIFEAMDQTAVEGALHLTIRAAGTTGAGRKFSGRVAGADLIMNEITAHARAASELNPATDTIIEIGGQDSKFTTLRNGEVVFCQMNTVCAAGTGSFIEEQAAKLGVPLGDYSRRAEGVRSPLASDRCTVFMERDINHYLNMKYSVEEILAAVLFSVRENYLLKVASEALIGDVVCFQGATAKNRALVAAFEQKLGKPIHVSRYCHLTGALGVALALSEQLPEKSSFRGVELFRQEIPVRSETCGLCANRCRLRLAEVQGETVAYGFLCGRDYDIKKYVSRNRSGFDMLGEYRLAFHGSARKAAAEPGGKTIGIPAALHLFGELPLWTRFFLELNIPTTTSETFGEALKNGKELAGAEFCAPITALHGHARYLARNCDYVFLPFFLEAPQEDRRSGRLRYFCYYTQFAPTVVSILKDSGLEDKCLTPLVDHRSLEAGAGRADRGVRARTLRELYLALREKAGFPVTLGAVSRAYDRALAHYREGQRTLRTLFGRTYRRDGDIQAAIIGRPYLILSPDMNKGIPDIFASLGIRCLSQEMIPKEIAAGGGADSGMDPAVSGALREIGPLLDAFHWQFAARVLETAAACTRIEGLYPVMITAFKCSPDSFVIEYFKRILDARDKPYLILQLDEHDSNVGYETRIEAGVHSFRNHYRREREGGGVAAEGARSGSKTGTGRSSEPTPDERTSPRRRRSVVPLIDRSLKGKILLFPNWDTFSSPLVVANLQGAGIDARLLEENPLTIQKSMRLNTGQCIPINIITQETVDYIRSHGLDPERVVLWMGKSDWSCGIHIYPHYIKSLLEIYGEGMERARVYVGDISHSEISPLLPVNTYFAYLFGGLLRRIGCRIRPYEMNKGETDRVIAEAQEIFARTFRERGSKLKALARVMGKLEAVSRRESRRPKVAIFGDLYVRDNDVMNQDLVRRIEEAGGEVVTTPYSEYVRIIAGAYFQQWRKEKKYLLLLKNRTLLGMIQLAERRFLPHLRPYVGSPRSYRNPRVEEDLARFHLRLEHYGESYDNVLKILYLLKEQPDIRLFVQTNPAFCCPSLITEAMARKIEEVTGVPVVTLTYDGTGSDKNDLVVPYLKRLSESGEHEDAGKPVLKPCAATKGTAQS